MITDVEKVENLLKIGNYKKLFRINYKGQRIYLEENPFMFYSGLTSALSAATFNGSMEHKRLKGWRENMIDSFGKRNSDVYMDMTADFGTLLHMALLTIKEEGRINWNEETEKAYGYFVECYRKQQIEPNLKVIRDMVYDYQKHVASLMQFVYERVEEIYAIETPAIWDEMKIATPIDLYCSCRQTAKGGFEKTTINLKTSSQIGKHQIDQVSCELLMWNLTYPDKADFTAILRTKDWKEGKVPTYEYKYINSSEAIETAMDIGLRLKLCLMSDASYYPQPRSKEFTGITKIGDIPEIVEKTLEQSWVDYNQQKDE